MIWIWLKSAAIIALFMVSLIWLPLYLFYGVSFLLLVYVHRLEKELKKKKDLKSVSL